MSTVLNDYWQLERWNTPEEIRWLRAQSNRLPVFPPPPPDVLISSGDILIMWEKELIFLHFLYEEEMRTRPLKHLIVVLFNRTTSTVTLVPRCFICS